MSWGLGLGAKPGQYGRRSIAADAPDGTLVADTRSIVLTGTGTNLTATRELLAATQSYAVTGIDATLVGSGGLTAETGSFVLTGIDATLTAAQAFSPTSLFASGEKGGWGDAEDGFTYQDSARTTAAVSGDPVGALDDQSGNANHFVQPTSTLRPTKGVSGTLPYIAGDGVDDLMNWASIPSTISQPFTLAMVNSTPSGGSRLHFSRSGTTPYFGYSAGNNLYYAPGSFNQSTETIAVDTWHYVEVVFNGASSDLKLNGTSLTTSAPSGTAAFIGAPRLGVGTSTIKTAFWLLIDRELTAGERTNLEAYMAALVARG